VEKLYRGGKKRKGGQGGGKRHPLCPDSPTRHVPGVSQLPICVLQREKKEKKNAWHTPGRKKKGSVTLSYCQGVSVNEWEATISTRCRTKKGERKEKEGPKRSTKRYKKKMKKQGERPLTCGQPRWGERRAKTVTSIEGEKGKKEKKKEKYSTGTDQKGRKKRKNQETGNTSSPSRGPGEKQDPPQSGLCLTVVKKRKKRGG